MISSQKHIRLRFQKIIVASVIIVALSFCMLPSAYAATTGYYYNGGCKAVSNNGVVATIETQNPYVYSGSSVSAWAMTCDGGSSSANGYAQVGYLKYSRDSRPYYFYEYSCDSTSTWYQKQLTSSPSTGTHHTYMVGCDSSTMYFKIDGTSYGTCKLSAIPFPRTTIEVLTETHHASDQSPGSASNPVTMGAVQYKTTSNVWTNTKCVNWSNNGYGTLKTQRNNIPSSGSSNWEVWDSRY